MAEHDFGSRAVPCLDASALAGLAERVAAATGPSRKLDYALSALDPGVVTAVGAWGGACNYTASLDAALALVERRGHDVRTVLRAALDRCDQLARLPLAVLAVLLHMEAGDGHL